MLNPNWRLLWLKDFWRWFRRKQVVDDLRSKDPWDLATPLFDFGCGDFWTIDDAFQGVQLFGSTGSGKSSGSFATLLMAFLRAGFGGILFTCKPDDAETYIRLCNEAGRADDVIVFGAKGSDTRFNPFDFELRRTDAGAGHTRNLVAIFEALLEVSERSSGRAGGDDGGYWQRACRQLMTSAIDLLVLAKGRLLVSDLYRLVLSAPTSAEQLASGEWRKSAYCFECLSEADQKTQTESQRKDFELVTDYFLVEWVGLSDRTRSVVLSTFTSMLDVLNRGLIRDTMTGVESNVTPDMCQDGTIFIIDFPSMFYGELGIFVAVIWKFALQRTQERRDLSRSKRPVFMMADEAHLIAIKHDQVFQTTARSTRTATVYASQCMTNYLAAMGPDSEPQVHSLLSNLQTKIFHQQGDIKTNEYAANLIGRSRQFLINASNSHSQQDWISSMLGQSDGHATGGVSECWEYELQPETFALLRKGGPPHWCVDAIVVQGGRRFNTTGKPWRNVTFQQILSNPKG